MVPAQTAGNTRYEFTATFEVGPVSVALVIPRDSELVEGGSMEPGRVVTALAAPLGLVGDGQLTRGRLACAHPARGDLVDIGCRRLHVQRARKGVQ